MNLRVDSLSITVYFLCGITFPDGGVNLLGGSQPVGHDPLGVAYQISCISDILHIRYYIMLHNDSYEVAMKITLCSGVITTCIKGSQHQEGREPLI